MADEQKQQAGIERLKREAEAKRKAREAASAQGKEGPSKDKQAEAGSLAEETGITRKQSLDEQAEAQWLRRIPDDPGGLLRNKFRYQYRRQQPERTEDETW